jgi:FkbM family methyltransferase
MHLATLRRLNKSRLLRRIQPLHGWLRRVAWRILEASVLDQRLTYLRRETFGKADDPARYRLRRSRKIIFLRHRSGDIEIFRKFFLYRYYEFPEPVLVQLHSLRRRLRVLDLGANIGLFGIHAVQTFPVAQITSLEPDPLNAEVIERVIRANELESVWHVVRVAAAAKDGSAQFLVGRKNLSRVTRDSGTSTLKMPLIDVLPYLKEVDLAKINIEGSEWEILQDERFKKCAPNALVLEYHRIDNPDRDIHGLATALLREAGFNLRSVVRDDENGLIWAWKETSEARADVNVASATTPR